MPIKETKHINLWLADDDEDDRMFFKDALNEIPVNSSLVTVSDGEQLMNALLNSEKTYFPDLLFLDLNMPRKTGFECLSEIKLNEQLRDLPVIIFSTSLDRQTVDLLYETGAHYYIRKPGSFSSLKKILLDTLTLAVAGGGTRASKENFVITA